MSEMKFISDPTIKSKLRFIANIGGNDDPQIKFMVSVFSEPRPTGRGNHNTGRIIVAGAANADAAISQIDELKALLDQAKNLLRNFSGGTDRIVQDNYPEPIVTTGTVEYSKDAMEHMHPAVRLLHDAKPRIGGDSYREQ